MLDPPASAARNMAIDEALYLSARDSHRATVRLYAFDPPTVSLGYRQALAEAIDEAACRRHGVDIVRRITGGWALLHQHELTWSVTAPARAGVFRALSVKDAYRGVNGAIRRACQALGVRLDPEREANDRAPRAPGGIAPPCLAVPSIHEITVSGRKLVPSAQRRHRESLLQHGSILFRVDRSLWSQIRPERGAEELHAVGLTEVLPVPPSRETLTAELERSFAAFFEEDGVVSGLDEAERQTVRELERKYASRSHLLRAGYIDNSEAVW